jgi:hypothetical protein
LLLTLEDVKKMPRGPKGKRATWTSLSGTPNGYCFLYATLVIVLGFMNTRIMLVNFVVVLKATNERLRWVAKEHRRRYEMT